MMTNGTLTESGRKQAETRRSASIKNAETFRIILLEEIDKDRDAPVPVLIRRASERFHEQTPVCNWVWIIGGRPSGRVFSYRTLSNWAKGNVKFAELEDLLAYKRTVTRARKSIVSVKAVPDHDSLEFQSQVLHRLEKIEASVESMRREYQGILTATLFPAPAINSGAVYAGR